MKKKILLFMLSGMMMLSPVTTIYATETVTVSDNAIKSTASKTYKVTKLKKSKKMYVKKKVSTYKEPSSTAKKVKTLNKGKSVVVIGKATDSKGRAWYQIKTTSGKQFIIASALSKTKPKTTSSATTGNSSSSTSNQNNNNSNSSTNKNNSNKNNSSKEYTRENYKTHPVYNKLPASERKKIDKIMNKFDITYSEMAYVQGLVGGDTIIEWMNDGATWDSIVKMAERATGDHILECCGQAFL
ncbi:MAG: SH3 domain-containing protein [Lachnospiraceae bacterium]|nr:SH3 domain-containing protein [Lachnospiraceae bacterium]